MSPYSITREDAGKDAEALHHAINLLVGQNKPDAPLERLYELRDSIGEQVKQAAVEPAAPHMEALAQIGRMVEAYVESHAKAGRTILAAFGAIKELRQDDYVLVPDPIEEVEAEPVCNCEYGPVWPDGVGHESYCATLGGPVEPEQVDAAVLVKKVRQIAVKLGRDAVKVTEGIPMSALALNNRAADLDDLLPKEPAS